MLQYDPDAFVINSFSKYYGMPGWRLGWIVCPPDLVAEARARIGNLFLSPPALSQQAALAAFDCEDALDARVAMYRRNQIGRAPVATPVTHAHLEWRLLLQ